MSVRGCMGACVRECMRMLCMCAYLHHNRVRVAQIIHRYQAVCQFNYFLHNFSALAQFFLFEYGMHGPWSAITDMNNMYTLKQEVK